MAIGRRELLAGMGAATVAVVTGCSSPARPGGRTATPAPSAPTPSSPVASGTGAASPRVLGTVAAGLDVPWGIAFTTAGDALVSERDSGRIVRIAKDGTVSTLRTVPGVDLTSGQSEGGLLGLALSPDGATLYAYHSTVDDNRIVSMSFDGVRAGDPVPILTGIPRGLHHNGGRLLIGPDRLLYASTGESGVPALAQERGSLGGKVLRLRLDGSPAAGNPYGTAVWTLGHRNIEGLAFDASRRLWATEFGDRRADELNLIERGANYGWPQTEGATGARGITGPKVTWPTEECSPSGLAIVGGTAYIGALRGECLYSVALSGTRAATPLRHFDGRYGRIRGVAAAPDGTVWMTTSNRDGRATPRRGDDQILRVRVTA